MIVGLNIDPELELDNETLARVMEDMLNMGARLNAGYFLRNPDAPCCLDCGTITYFEPAMSERVFFGLAPDVIRQRKTSCAGAAMYEAGHAIAKGKDARVVIQINGPGDFHALVRYPNGSVTDPSADLPR